MDICSGMVFKRRGIDHYMWIDFLTIVEVDDTKTCTIRYCNRNCQVRGFPCQYILDSWELLTDTEFAMYQMLVGE